MPRVLWPAACRRAVGGRAWSFAKPRCEDMPRLTHLRTPDATFHGMCCVPLERDLGTSSILRDGHAFLPPGSGDLSIAEGQLRLSHGALM